jgi:hypothetical protein
MAGQQREEIRNLKSSFYNRGLAEWERSVGKVETIGLASIFGGTSIYGGIL